MRSLFKVIFLLLLGSFLLYLVWVPYVPGLKNTNPKTTALMELRKEQMVRKGRKPVQKMIWRNLSEISPHLVHAVVIAEDDTFYQHQGFDWEQIKIAVEINWKKKRFAYGGSTISQQLARNLYLSPSKNLLRKLKEAEITFWLERSLSKKRILEIYLNVIEWGDGVYGAEAAARHYFDKSCSDLTPEESVALSSILPSPRKWSPLRETPFMIRRRGNIIARMRLAGYLPLPAPAPKEVEPEPVDEEQIEVEEVE